MQRVRALFVSDVHLGTRECQAERLLTTLALYRSDYLYLLGDIVDLWAMARGLYWSTAHNAVVQEVLARAQAGVKVTFVPGNHDGALRAYQGMAFGQVRVQGEAVHRTADGARLLLLHGDRFDDATRYHHWVAWLGDAGYAALMWSSGRLTRLRHILGRDDHWSLASAVKRRLPGARAYVHDFEVSAARYAAEHGFDGVVCGHIHVPAIKNIEGVGYRNCGDWVESASVLIEHTDGAMSLARAPATRKLPRRRTALGAELMDS